MYTDRNFKTKKELKEAVANGEEITYHQPGGLFGLNANSMNGTVAIEGPHYPKPHTWYATCKVEDGVIVSVK